LVTSSVTAATTGGDLQAVYVYAVEDLQWWADQLGATLTSGQFGENLTVSGMDVNRARIGERWRVGSTELQVTGPRIPCATFRGWMNRPGWLRAFAAAARPGPYLSVVRDGTVQQGDDVDVVHRPAHDVTIEMVFRALTLQPELLPRLLDAPELDDELREMAERGQTFDIG
jgi:MOSC domain-containing protein YiiM